MSDSPRVSSILSVATSTGISAGVTVKVDSTARWSDGHGVTVMLAAGLPSSPTIWLLTTFDGPAV